jgi:hypothetical protein
VLFSLATLTRPRIREDLSLRSRRLTELRDAVRRCSAACDTATGENGQRLTLHLAAVRAQSTGPGAAQTTWQLSDADRNGYADSRAGVPVDDRGCRRQSC